ncbi:hypothetical protein A1Q1_03067 [Trichosporon asahii var. asahii CBS 2479]|uniref:Uncharacterized protein n=1 Tax=Trichosporon asahii var. asahii (strain ATCC 90039 / CBS 2479 / JCM 2466 / KCTC 7840 / NBRC 103889/ NCYC 2677 / UAMH 7654) TaxID=1186058 RepID=J5RH50_TRIAS|nr:hypothetical protein A1Q1_03067 [Trichosporon asahii var. asahii CBS 2479]EJT52613.1 hypothetical protein A1Q1_03067 [Trichosporon asahii var. asahii CBS 2479]
MGRPHFRVTMPIPPATAGRHHAVACAIKCFGQFFNAIAATVRLNILKPPPATATSVVSDIPSGDMERE